MNVKGIWGINVHLSGMLNDIGLHPLKIAKNRKLMTLLASSFVGSLWLIDKNIYLAVLREIFRFLFA